MKYLDLFTIIVFTLRTVSSNVGIDENPQCVLSQMEQYIKDFDKQFTFFPTIKKLKKVYPGESFKDTTESGCSDLASEQYCKPAAERGCCNGTYYEVCEHC